MLSKKTVVYNGEPFTYALSFHKQLTHCDFCLKRATVKMCTACYYVGYCDEECQKSGWSEHKYECKEIKSNLLENEVISDDVRLFAKLIRKVKKYGRNKISQLDSNSKYFETNKRLNEEFNEVYSELLEFMGEQNMPDKNELMELYGIMTYNTFPIYDIDMLYIGHAIYPLPKTIKHSCSPNTTYVHYQRRMIITSKLELEEINWENLTIAYCDIMGNTSDRQWRLKEKFYKDCECERCNSPTRDALCPNKDCKSACSVEEDKCYECNTVLTDQFKRTYESVINFVKDFLNRNDDVFNIKMLNVCLRKFKDIVHPYNYLYIKTVERMCTFEEHNGHWLRSLRYLEDVLNGFRHYYSDYSLFTLSLYYRRAKLLLLVDNMELYEENMKKIAEICIFLYDDKGAASAVTIASTMVNTVKQYQKTSNEMHKFKRNSILN